jgi:hypothetical protein
MYLKESSMSCGNVGMCLRESSMNEWKGWDVLGGNFDEKKWKGWDVLKGSSMREWKGWDILGVMFN